MERRELLKGLGLFLTPGALGALLAACGSDSEGSAEPTSATTAPGTVTADAPAASSTTAAEATSVDTLRLAGGQWGYPSPFAYNRGPGLAHCLMMFDTLTWKDSSGESIGWLASAWSSTADGLEWTFTLHEASWHDGTPLTADDVAFTFDYFINGAGKNAIGIVGRLDFIGSVSAVDPRTAKVVLSRPYAPFEELVSGRVPILPKHIWAEVADPVKFRGPTALIGCGPYKADSIDETAGTYRYVANEDHYLGVPFVKVLEFVPARDELLALENGDIDAGSPPSEDGVPDEALAAFEGDEWAMLEEQGEFTRAFHINMSKGFPFDNKAFRQALAYSIDRADLVKRLLFGRGEPGSVGGLAPSHPWLAPGLPAYAVDVAKAGSLLDSIGIVDSDGDGVRELPGGEAFQVELQTSSRYSPKTAELIKEYLRAVGIECQVSGLDSNTADDNAAKGNYQLALVGYGGFGGEADSLRTRYSAAVKSQAFSRVLGYNNPEFEQLAAQQVAVVDPAARKALVQRMQQLLADDVAMIPLYFPSRLLISRVEVFDNWYYTPGGVFGGYPGVLNKHSFSTGKKTGF